MGAPSVNIAFIEKAATVIQRGERGVIAMLLKESAVTPQTIRFIPLRIFLKRYQKQIKQR